MIPAALCETFFYLARFARGHRDAEVGAGEIRCACSCRKFHCLKFDFWEGNQTKGAYIQAIFGSWRSPPNKLSFSLCDLCGSVRGMFFLRPINMIYRIYRIRKMNILDSRAKPVISNHPVNPVNPVECGRPLFSLMTNRGFKMHPLYFSN